MKRKVLHVINGEYYAGAERVQDLLAARLPQFGYEVGFACVRPAAFETERTYKDAPLFNAKMSRRLDLRPARSLITIIRREGYQLIHTHTNRSAIIGLIAARATGIPIIHHIHGPASREGAPAWLNWLNMRLERAILRRMDAIITVSESLARSTAECRVPRERVTVVPNGVPTPTPLSARAVPGSRWLLGTVALFRPGKGLEILLDALQRVVAKGHDVNLHLVGSFEPAVYRDEIHRQASRLDLTSRIVWRGFQRNVYDELAQMDLFVLPSLSEGMPMAVLEAMAAGVPIVATKLPGVAEVVRDGIDGLLATPGDAGSLTDCLLQFLEGKVDWNAIRTAAYQRHIDSYSDVVMARAVARVYSSLVCA